MKRLSIFIAAVALSGAAFAGGGTTGAASLKLGAGARGQGMGDAYSAMAEGAESLFWNPAGLVAGNDRSLMLGFQPMLDNTSVGQAAAAGRFGKFGAGAGFSGLKQDSLNGLDDVGNPTGSFQAKDQTFVGGGAWGGDRFSVGVSANYWSSTIDGQTASVFAGDLGLGFRSPMSPRVRHAFVVRHVGGSVSYVSQKDPLPTTAVFGTSFRFRRPLSVELDASWERDQGAYFSSGLEWTAVKTAAAHLDLRGGYTSRRNEAGGLSGAAFGLGVAFKSLSFDYAWIPFGDLGDSHAFTLTWRPAEEPIDAPKRRERPSKKARQTDPSSKDKIDRSSGRRQLQDLAPPRRKE